MKYTISKDIKIKETTNACGLAFNMETGTLYELNESGCDIIKIFQIKDNTLEEVITQLTAIYEIKPNEIQDDVAFLINSMIKAKVLEEVNE